jgi:osmotically inducible protein OsmC
MIKRTGSAVWKGDLKSGSGTLTTGSGTLKQTAYSFGTRFENAAGTNPEELIAAAHAGCFSMALSLKLTEAGMKPERIETTATATLEKTDAGMTITAIHLDLHADVPNADPAKFEATAKLAKETCIVSRVLNAKITMEAKLRSGMRL